MTQFQKYMYKFFADKRGKIVVGQMPNAPITIWALFAVLARLLSPGDARDLAHGISKTAIILWAILEIISGVSPFRRVLGVIVLVASIISLL